jgi:LysM repeat protein
MKKDQPFKVPEDYFENLSDRIQEKIELEENPKKRMLQVLKPYVWMAASIIGIVFIAKVVLTNSVDPNYKIQQYSQSEISIDTQSVIVNTDDLNWFSDEEELTSEEIIEYLSDYDIETETLLANL